MPSAAYANWTGDRSDRLDQLISAHGAMGGGGPGRRWRTEQVNWALVLRLAGEFQGYCRDLHDDAVDFFVVSASPNLRISSVLRAQLTSNRRLDRGNAQPDALKHDFRSLGIDLFREIQAASPVRGPQRWLALGQLNKARNAIAHANYAELAGLRNDGYPITMRTISTWRSQVDGLAQTMDDVVAGALDALFGAGPDLRQQESRKAVTCRFIRGFLCVIIKSNGKLMACQWRLRPSWRACQSPATSACASTMAGA